MVIINNLLTQNIAPDGYLTVHSSSLLQVEQNEVHKDYWEDPVHLVEAQRPDGRKDRSHDWLRQE